KAGESARLIQFPRSPIAQAQADPEAFVRRNRPADREGVSLERGERFAPRLGRVDVGGISQVMTRAQFHLLSCSCSCSCRPRQDSITSAIRSTSTSGSSSFRTI